MKFEIGQTLRNKISGEQGVCKGRSEYAPEFGGQPQYWVRFKDAQGRAAADWWPESNVEAA